MWLTPAHVDFPPKVTDAHIQWLCHTQVHARCPLDPRAQLLLPSWLLCTRACNTHLQALPRGVRGTCFACALGFQRTHVSSPTQPNTDMDRLVQQIPVRRIVFVKDTLPYASAAKLGWHKRSEAALQNCAWNSLQHMSWAIASNLEVFAIRVTVHCVARLHDC